MYLGAEIGPGAIRDPEALRRIGRVYALARYVQRNFHFLITVMVLVLGAFVTVIVVGFRHRRARRAGGA